MDDVRAVMDAVGSERAALLGVSEGGPMCSLFATTYPEKTRALVMIGTYAQATVGARLSVGADARTSASASSRDPRATGAARWASRCARRAGPRDPAFRDVVEHLPADGRQPRRGAAR